MISPKKILELVIDRLSNKETWIKGTWARKATNAASAEYGAGCRTVDPAAACYCVGGAIIRELAAAEDMIGVNMPETRFIQKPEFQVLTNEIYKSAAELYPNTIGVHNDVPTWNDNPGTTHESMMHVLKHTLERLPT